MSKKIPFLEMFAALTQWAEFVNAMEGWVITEASIDRSSRSAVVTVEGAYDQLLAEGYLRSEARRGFFVRIPAWKNACRNLQKSVDKSILPC